MWALAWVADYPGRNDFLGVLLNTGAGIKYPDTVAANPQVLQPGDAIPRR